MTTHAEEYTFDVLDLFKGPFAAKRLARAVNCSVRTAEEWVNRRRRLSLDAAVELAAANVRAEEALFLRIKNVRERNATAQTVGAATQAIRAAQTGRVGDEFGRMADRARPGSGASGAGDARDSMIRTFTVATGLMGSVRK